MISGDTGFRAAKERLLQMYDALDTVRRENAGSAPKWRAVLGEGFLAEARRVTRELEEYLGAEEIEGQLRPVCGEDGMEPMPPRPSREIEMGFERVARRPPWDDGPAGE